MSLLSNKRVHLLVQPAAVRASLWRGWPKSSKVAEQVRDGGIAAAGDVLAALAGQAPVAGASLHVELADALVHFDVASGDFAGKSAHQLSLFASACVAELLGEQAKDCTVRWQLQRDERHLLLCATPNAVISALADAAIAQRLQLASLSPSFAAQWNRHARGRWPDAAVFAVASTNNTTIACVRHGVITTMSAGPGSSAGADARRAAALSSATGDAPLDLHVDRLLAGLGADGEQSLVYLLVTAAKPQPALSKRWRIVSTEPTLAADPAPDSARARLGRRWKNGA